MRILIRRVNAWMLSIAKVKPPNQEKIELTSKLGISESEGKVSEYRKPNMQMVRVSPPMLTSLKAIAYALTDIENVVKLTYKGVKVKSWKKNMRS